MILFSLFRNYCKLWNLLNAMCDAAFAVMMKRSSQVDKLRNMFKTGSSNEAYSEMVELTEKVAR